MKKILLFMIPLLLLSSSVYATDNNKVNDIITKTEIINISDEENFLNTIDKTIDNNGITYLLDNIYNEKLETTTTKTVEQKKVIELSTNNKDEILNTFPESIKYNKDNYKGTLNIVDSSLVITSKDNGSYETIDSFEKVYNNLQESDLDSIPKEITKNGYVYILTECNWEISESQKVQEISMPKTYIANTTYKTVKTIKYPTTYRCTVNYSGEVKKTSTDKIKYTLEYKPVEKNEENKTNVLPYLGGTGVFLIVIAFLIPNTKITNYQNGKHKTLKYIRVSARKPNINLKHLTGTRTNVIFIKFNSNIAKKLKGKPVNIITSNGNYQKMIIDKSIEIHI